MKLQVYAVDMSMRDTLSSVSQINKNYDNSLVLIRSRGIDMITLRSRNDSHGGVALLWLVPGWIAQTQAQASSYLYASSSLYNVAFGPSSKRCSATKSQDHVVSD